MWDDVGALGRLTRRLLVLMTFLLIGSGIAWLYNSKYFPVKQIAIQGKLKYASSKELQTVAREHIRGNMFRADIDSAQAAFQELPWIDSVMVRRRFPETVEIILTERVPVAHWRAGGLMDSKGNVFAASLKQDLPIFEGQQGTGKDMVKHYADFSGILSPLKLTIKELIYTPRSAWLLVLNNGITVRLGRENEIKRLQQFAQIWPSLLRKKQSRIEYVDMRYKDGFSVRYRPPENPSNSE